MQKTTDEKIGHVTITRIGDQYNKAIYSDGDVESLLLELFKDGFTEEQRRERLADPDLDWAFRYHISYERANLLSWYDFPKGSSVLEVGAGCGAITESILQHNNDIQVTANELSERRALVNAHRNQNYNNLEVVIGNLQDFEPASKFDYVVCVGVLEYAATFITDPEPYLRFLNQLNSFLKPGGKLLLAIENKLGMKYFAGAPEDHHGQSFVGLNNYSNHKNVQTFTKNGLSNLLVESNFDDLYFYYPHPDYKLPKVVYSDDFLPGKQTEALPGLYPSTMQGLNRFYVFSEQNVMQAIEESQIFEHFANSFLVEAIKNEK